MKFEIVSRQFKDQNIENLIIKMFEYFAATNSSRLDQNKPGKNREDLLSFLNDLANYVESGLKKKFSLNFIVLISEHPNYAVKYEKHYMICFKFLNFEILVIKTPFICVPARFGKNLNSEDLITIENFYETRKEEIKSKNLKVLKYQNKYYDTVHNNNKKILKLQKFKEEYLKDLVIKNISFYNSTAANEKDVSKLALGLQYDLCEEEREYNWCVLTSKQQIYSKELPASSQIFFHCKITNNDKNLNINGLRDTEILIFKKEAIFESILKNIVTGKFYEVELKHMVVLFSVIIFFLLVSYCRTDYSTINMEELPWLERNVCGNKSSIISGIALMFIIAVVSGILNKRLNNKKQKKPQTIEAPKITANKPSTTSNSISG